MSSSSESDGETETPKIFARKSALVKEAKRLTRKRPDSPVCMSKDGKPQYYVERILDERMNDGQLEYLIKWEGYPDSENSWEAASGCVSLRGIGF